MCHPVANRTKPHGQYKGVSGGKRNTYLNKCAVLRNGCGTISLRAVLGTGRSHKPYRAPFDSVARYHHAWGLSIGSLWRATIDAPPVPSRDGVICISVQICECWPAGKMGVDARIA
jgi:hypothetical protein